MSPSIYSDENQTTARTAWAINRRCFTCRVQDHQPVDGRIYQIRTNIGLTGHIVNTAPLNPINRKNLIWRWFHSFPLYFLTRVCKLKNTVMSSPIPVLGLGWSLSGGLHWLGTIFTFGLTGSVMDWLWDIKAIWSLFEIVMNPGQWLDEKYRSVVGDRGSRDS